MQEITLMIYSSAIRIRMEESSIKGAALKSSNERKEMGRCSIRSRSRSSGMFILMLWALRAPGRGWARFQSGMESHWSWLRENMIAKVVWNGILRYRSWIRVVYEMTYCYYRLIVACNMGIRLWRWRIELLQLNLLRKASVDRRKSRQEGTG